MVNLIRKPIILTAVAISTAVGVGGYVWANEHREKVLEVYVLNLKNGNSTFIRTPNDKRILINGGGNSEIIRHLSKILPFYSRRVDMVIATNTEKKNIGGLIEVIERYSVERVVVPNITLESLHISSSTDRTYAEFLKSLRTKKILLREVAEGDDIVLDNITAPNVVANILFPTTTSNFSYSKASPPEIVLNISFDLNNILIAGNSSKKIQRYIASSISSNIADVLVLSQSALPNNLNREFLETFQPKFLVYSRALSQSQSQNNFSYDRRFNSKEKTVEIISDGKSVNFK